MITKEPVVVGGELFYKYTIDVNPMVTTKRGLDRIQIEFLGVQHNDEISI